MALDPDSVARISLAHAAYLPAPIVDSAWYLVTARAHLLVPDSTTTCADAETASTGVRLVTGEERSFGAACGAPPANVRVAAQLDSLFASVAWSGVGPSRSLRGPGGKARSRYGQIIGGSAAQTGSKEA